MRVERRDSSQEKNILTAMIVDRVVLGAIAPKWEKGEGLFKSKWCNLVAGWCVSYFLKYEKAPKRAIEGMFENWASENQDDVSAKLIEKLLFGLSDSYVTLAKESNSAFIVDTASKYFNRVKKHRLAEAIQAHLDSGEDDKAEEEINKFTTVEIGMGAGVNVLHDQNAIREAFTSKQEPLIVYPGALGKFFGGALERDGFIGFLGPEKRGKSWWLMDVAWRGMEQRRKVAYFEVGDMSQNQVIRRLMIRASRQPMKASSVKYPTAIEHDREKDTAEVTFKEKEYPKDLSWQRGWEACQEVINDKLKSTTPLLKLSCHPNSSLSVPGIVSILQLWQRQENWVPDVIVVDYADILAPIKGLLETREQINGTWKALRALSQSTHTLVVTATQANAASYAATTVDQSNFSEDKRKFAHVTGMVGLNVTKAEKELGVMRLNWVVLREGEFTTSKCVHVATCLPLGNPAVRSCW